METHYTTGVKNRSLIQVVKSLAFLKLHAPQPVLNQSLIKRIVSANSVSYCQKLYKFTKLQALVELQMSIGLKLAVR